MFWFPDADGWPRYAHSIAFVTISAIMGLLMLGRRRDPTFVFFASALFTYPLLYYLVQSDLRYRTPILWISLLAGGYFLTELAANAPRWLDERTNGVLAVMSRWRIKV
jgi:hypothetical protein